MKSVNPIHFKDLARTIAGDLSCSDLDRYLLATDGSIFKKEPAAVLYPKSTRDVVATIRFARRHGLSIHPRGAGSGLCGSALGDGVVIDFSRHMNRLLDLDPAKQQFTCEPGYRYGELSRALKGSGLFFPPDPSSGEYASLGGMYATNASGAHSVKYGNVAEYVVDAEIVTATGEVITLSQIARTPPAGLQEPFGELYDLYQSNSGRIEAAYPKVQNNVAGYNLRSLVVGDRLHLQRLFAGAEGTLGAVTKLTFRLLPKPAHDSLVVAFFDSIQAAARAVTAVLPLGPSGIEIMDKSLLELARKSDPVLKQKIPGGIDNVLLMEFDGSVEEDTRAQGQRAQSLLFKQGLTEKAFLALSAAEKQKFWAVRTAAVPILYRLKGQKKILALIEDAVVPIAHLEAYFKSLYEILKGHGVRFVLYGHIAKGLIHTRPLLDLKSPENIALLQAIADDVFELVHGLGGVVSGEHGDGRLRSAYIARHYPEIYPLFLSVKSLLDPVHLFNPEIKINAAADQMCRHLRYGEAYRRTDFSPSNLNFDASFADEVEKCHGCSKCTTVTTATRMCPIYKFTRREAAAPKAKANILRALISGALPADTLYRKELQEIIDQCVNCGSCRVECPSHVDIPKLALEARSRWVAAGGAPAVHHLVTGVEQIGRLMTVAGVGRRLVEKSMNVPFLAELNERVTGLSRRRPFLSFAARNLKAQKLPLARTARLRVLYFAGCYAGYLRPEIGQALASVLAGLNIRLYLPEQHCCGLPHMTKGMLKQARQRVRANLTKWYDLVDRVDYIVVTCSSCGLALMTEWGALSGDGRIRKIEKKIIHASHLIGRYWVERYMVGRYLDPSTMSTQALRLAYHMPCHLKVQPHAQSSIALLSGLPGLALDPLESHCCGMAGTWGMTAANDALSRKIGNDLIALLDARQLDGVVTDCPTCAMQLEHLGRHPVAHPVEVVRRYCN